MSLDKKLESSIYATFLASAFRTLRFGATEAHGRGMALQLNFIADRERSPGEFMPKDAFVLHPYGRYCNANKLAGEVDFFEAMTNVTRHYSIDVNRIAVRGFSMGGAACWQFAVHHSGLWAAAAPGAACSR